ncbi:MAG TPA: hypothetical protein VG870_08190 [Chitinophagaceae bacterium]|nr:hypothetical protein [Chitinophagaceae bacterium]
MISSTTTGTNTFSPNIWLAGDYPSFTYGSAPTGAQLNATNAIGTIQINVGSGSTPDQLSATYTPGGGTPRMLSGTLTKQNLTVNSVNVDR